MIYNSSGTVEFENDEEKETIIRSIFGKQYYLALLNEKQELSYYRKEDDQVVIVPEKVLTLIVNDPSLDHFRKDQVTTSDEPDLKIDEKRLDRDFTTGVYVRAVSPDGKWYSVDMGCLEKESFMTFVGRGSTLSPWTRAIFCGAFDYERDA